MAILRWDPTRDVNSLQSEMNRVFSTFFDSAANQSGGGGGGGSGARWLPAMDLSESGESYVVHADLPGMSEDDVQIELEDNVLTIAGERRLEESKSDGYLRTERARGSFMRSLTLPPGVDAQRIEANFHRGVLELRIPKPEQRKPRRISIGGTGANRTIEGHESDPTEQAETNGQRQEEYSTS